MGAGLFVDWVGVRTADGAVVLAGDGLAVVVVLAVEVVVFVTGVDVLDVVEVAGLGAAVVGRDVALVAGLDKRTQDKKTSFKTKDMRAFVPF